MRVRLCLLACRWLSWARFRCHTDCDVDPDNCLSEKLIKMVADHMVSYSPLGQLNSNSQHFWHAACNPTPQLCLKIVQADAAVVVVSLYAVYITVRTIPNH